MKQILITVFSSLILFSACANAQTVDPDSFEKGLSEKDVQLLDVRTPQEFEEGHIGSAMLANINEKDEFSRRVAALDKNKPVYVYCLGGGRSHKAVGIVKSDGFTNVVELCGGINAWRNADKKVEGVSNAPQMSEAEYNHLTSSNSLVLVDFGAPWCPPCRKMEPVIKELEKEYNGKIAFVKIDGGTQSSLMKSKNISAMPGFILYKDGQEVWRSSGVTNKSEFVTHIKQHSNQ
jgi:thioredoxin